MSECLHCGDCCRRMSPLSAPLPCPHLVAHGTFVLCGIYDRRPAQCASHDFPARFCPIGLDVLRLEYPRDVEAIRQRIDEGYRIYANDMTIGGSGPWSFRRP